MLYWIWDKLKLWLPFGLLLFLYKGKKGLPTNIKLRSGRNMKAVMLTTEYGLLFTLEKYNAARLEKLKETSNNLAKAKAEIDREINGLSFEVKEELFNGGE